MGLVCVCVHRDHNWVEGRKLREKKIRANLPPLNDTVRFILICSYKSSSSSSSPQLLQSTPTTIIIIIVTISKFWWLKPDFYCLAPIHTDLHRQPDRQKRIPFWVWLKTTTIIQTICRLDHFFISLCLICSPPQTNTQPSPTSETNFECHHHIIHLHSLSHSFHGECIEEDN